jgi:hypothetical protein
MTGKAWLAAVSVGLLLGGSGCMTCCHQSAKVALEVGPTCDIPACDRQHVYAFLVNGITPALPTGLEGLRDRLADRGFVKTYYGQLCHAPWYYYEMKRLHRENPSARFVVVGYDFGCAAASALAADAVQAGVPVDAVVLLDPVGKQPMGGCATRTVLVRCGCGEPAPHTESAAVPGANHFTLPAHPRTVDLVHDLLKESAVRVVHPEALDANVWGHEYAPPPRDLAVPPPGFAPDWLFLHDHAGPHAVPLTPVPENPLLPGPIAPALLPRGGVVQPPIVVPVHPVPFVIPNPVPPPGLPLPAPRKLDGTP